LKSEVTIYQGRGGDRNARAFDGARAVGDELARRLNVKTTTIGSAATVIDGGWREQLDAALPDLQALAARYDHLFRDKVVPVTALTRCAVALATLPIVARHRPDAIIVWFDAHGDVNTPETSATGYLGGLAISGATGMWDSGRGSDADLDRVILVGARDLDPAEQALVEGGRLRAVDIGPEMTDALKRAIAHNPVYVHLDCDVLEPGVVPTEYQVPGGLSLDDLRNLCRVLAGNEIVGLEIAEFQHVWQAGEDPVSPSPLIDALEPLLARIGTEAPAAKKISND